ncbi:MAG: hypothetical protein ACK5Z5_06930 [Neisseriaceae bacterium]
MKKSYKHIYILIGVLSLITLLFGCGGGSSGSTSGNNPTPPPTPYNPIGVQALNSLLQTANNSCTSTSCKSGLYYVTNAADLAKINSGLQAQDQSTDQWTNNRYAILVAPGTYNEESTFELGYYTQILGVAEGIDEVSINPGVQVHNQCGLLKGAPLSTQTDFKNNQLCLSVGGLNNFWRGIENFSMNLESLSRIGQTDLIFAVSQASPLRNIHITGSANPSANGLLLCDYQAPGYACGYTSGGFMANAKIDDKFNPGSQQQWLARNSNINNSGTALWNSVFVGNNFTVTPTPPGSLGFSYRHPVNNDWNDIPLSIVESTPVVAEKPFLQCNNCDTNTNIESLTWDLILPEIRHNAHGADTAPEQAIHINDTFYILSPKSGPTVGGVTTLNESKIEEINNFLATAGHNLIITPGVYNLDGGSINISQFNTNVLGLGLPSLVCTNNSGKACINISAEKSVRIAGLVLDAGYNLTDNLLQIGSQKNSNDNSAYPIILSDIFFRIAETQLSERDTNKERQTVAAMTIYTNNVIGDNLWLWRADHDKASSHSMESATQNLVTWNQDRAEYGLVVYGDNVTIYGLAVEHFRQNQTVWYGENGKVYFYQSEMPYDVPSLSSWVCKDPKTGTTSPLNGCASYVIESTVTEHQGVGFGVYTYFANAPIVAPAAIKAPSGSANISIEHLLGKWLNGQGSIVNLVTNSDQLSRQCWGYSVDSANQWSVMGSFNSTATAEACTPN